MELPRLLSEAFKFFSKNKLLLLFLVMYFAFVTFFLKGFYSIDPDFGWRYRVGELIYKSGIPKNDPFSYTMPSFPFVDHSWLFSLLVFITYSVFKNGFLSIFLAFLTFSSLYISLLRLDREDFEHSDMDSSYERWLYPTSLAVLSYLLLFFSVRAQIVSWFIFAVLNLALFRKDNYSRYRFFLPIIFFIWANFHGGYSIGLLVLFYFIFFRLIISRKGSWKDILIASLCLLATLITPYNIAGWREVASSVFDSRLRWSIAEWLPSFTYFDISMVFYVAISTGMVFLKGRYLPKIQRILFWILFVFGVSSRRNMPYFMIYSLPLTVLSIQHLFNEIKAEKLAKDRFKLMFNIVRIFSVFLLILQMYRVFGGGIIWFNNENRRSGFYPEKAVKYLKTTATSGEIFSDYGWGGFLIWKYPEKKVFIDGRMPSWKFVPPKGSNETASAYDDYLKIRSGEIDFNSISDKYEIKYVLWPREIYSLYNAIKNFVKDKLFFGDEENEFSFTKYLIENGWKLVYEDETAVVYKRVEN